MSKNGTMLQFGSKNKGQKQTRSSKKKIKDQQSTKKMDIEAQKKIELNQEPIQSGKRLRKLIQKEKQQSQHTQKIIIPEPDHEPLQDESQQQFKPQRFAMQDSDDIEAQKKQKNQKKNKKAPKNNTHLQDFVNKSKTKKQSKGGQNKIKKQDTQLLLSESFKNNGNRRIRKKSDEFIIPEPKDQQQNDQSDSKLIYQKMKAARNNIVNRDARNNTLNGDLSQNEAIKIAMINSLQDQKHKSNLDDYTYKPSKQNSKNNKIQIQNENKSKEKQKQKKQQKQIHIRDKKSPQNNKKQNSKRKKSQSKGRSGDEKPKGPLSGHVIFTTGQFQPYNKEQIIQVLRRLGAECPTSAQLPKKSPVSQLFVGLYCVDQFKKRMPNKDVTTTKKYQQAVNRKIPIINNYDIDAFFLRTCGKTLTDYIEQDRKIAYQTKIQFQQQIDANIQKQQLKHNQRQEKTAIKLNESQITQIFIPWTQKYKPKNISQVIGQKSQIKNIQEWLQWWEDIHLKGNKRQVKGKGGNTGDINSKAVLISGDPGLGKTTTAKLLAAHLGFIAVQFNASDVRNKASINLLQSNSKCLDGGHLQKRLIIMDQIDGMSTGDRGGGSAIIQMIKTTKVPIICICNDRQSQKIRSLANYCLDVKFHKPDKRLITNRLMDIIRRQHGKADQRAIQMVVEIFQNDIRKILTYLQIVLRTQTKHITLDTVNGSSAQSKDSTVMINHFEATRRLMNPNGMNLRQKLDTFFIDSDLMPLMVFENYLGSSKKNMKKQDFHKLVQANQAFVIADILDKKIRKEQQWGLMPSFGMMCCVYPIQKVSVGIGFPSFPAFLGKFSSERKNRRLLRELKYAISPMITGGSNAIKSQYSPMLFKSILGQLKRDNVDGVLDFMDSYSVSPGILNEHLACLQYNPLKLNLLADISTQTKTRLTKGYNKRHEATKMKVVKQKQKNQHEKFDPVLQEIEKEEQDDEPEQEQELVIQIKKPKKK